jgi:hypothetical protein
VITLSYARLAQLVERFIYTEDVGGSSPSARTREENNTCVLFSDTGARRRPNFSPEK